MFILKRIKKCSNINLYYSERNFKRAFEELNYDFFEANLLKSIILYDTGYVALAKKAFLAREQGI